MRVEKTDGYRTWIDALKDRSGRARILMRVDRLIHGNPGASATCLKESQNSRSMLVRLPGVLRNSRRTIAAVIGGSRQVITARDIAKALELNRNFAE